MRIRKILGAVKVNETQHCIAKLENGKFAVGCLSLWQEVHPHDQFDTLDAAFDHWYQTLPSQKSIVQTVLRKAA